MKCKKLSSIKVIVLLCISMIFSTSLLIIEILIANDFYGFSGYAIQRLTDQNEVNVLLYEIWCSFALTAPAIFVLSLSYSLYEVEKEIIRN